MVRVKRRVRDLFSEIKPFVQGKDVLDLGCVQHNMDNTKNNKWLHAFLVKNAKSVLGVDYLQAEVDALNKQGYNVVCADVQKMKFDRKFDVVVAGELIEHLENAGLFVGCVKECLKDDGIFILTFPNPYALSKIRSCLVKLTANPKINPEHTCWYTPDSVEELLRRYDMKIVNAFQVSKKGTVQHSLCKIIGSRFQGSFMVVAKKNS